MKEVQKQFFNQLASEWNIPIQNVIIEDEKYFYFEATKRELESVLCSF